MEILPKFDAEGKRIRCAKRDCNNGVSGSMICDVCKEDVHTRVVKAGIDTQPHQEVMASA